MDSELRLYLSKQAYPVYKNNCGEGQLFPQMSDMYFWCVVLGYKQSPKTLPPKLGGQKQGEIHFGAFDDEIQKPILKMIAVEAANDFKILSKVSGKGSDGFREIIQSYAEHGFSILNTQMSGKYTADKLMELLIENTII
ncbi:MAG: hypothetical protein ACOCUH_01030 [Bacteriovoracia bacterium]